MNEIFLDTETTGLSLKENHRIVEIACIETKDLIPTKNFFHKLINPGRDVPEDSVKIHGYTGEFLKDKDKFEKIANELINFISGKKINVESISESKMQLESEKSKFKLNCIDPQEFPLMEEGFEAEEISLDSQSFLKLLVHVYQII